MYLQFSFIFLFWPYLWDNPLNFYQLFISLDRDLIVKILFNGNFISNFPDTYIFWIMITSPIAQIIVFFWFCIYSYKKIFKNK